MRRARRLAADCARWGEKPSDLDRQTILIIERTITWTLWLRGKARAAGGNLALCVQPPAEINAPFASLVSR